MRNRKWGFQFWLALRYLRSGGRFVNVTVLLSFGGMVVGVAALVIAMAVVSGFETTLRKSVIDVAGDLMVIKAGGKLDPLSEIIPKIKASAPDMVAYTPFVQIEAIMARQGKTQGVVLQGVDEKSVHQVLSLKSRLVQGEFELSETENGISRAVIGKALAKKMNLKVGDEFRVVVPRPSKTNPNSFQPRSQKLVVAGVLDLGKYEYDLRFIITPSDVAHELAGHKSFTGLKIRLRDSDLARAASLKINQDLGYSYWTKDWSEVNKNLFAAIKLEKIVIFIVVLFMVITASFNICSSLFVNVLKRYGDLSILKAMGATPRFLTQLFSIQGMIIGVAGAVTGVILGIVMCFTLAHTSLFQVPPEVYKLDHLPVEIRALDLLVIVSVTFLICFLSTLAPALRGSKLRPVDGLRYE